MTHIDTDQLKRSADILQVLGSATTLRNETKTELSGPCPRCGGTDRFHLQTAEGWFFCRQCHPKRGDVIELVQFLGLAHSFADSCKYLGASMQSTTSRNQSAMRSARPKPKSNQPAREPAWRSPGWQREARQILKDAQNALNGPGGQSGRDYLLGRKIEPNTWQKWGLGYSHVWDGKQQRKRPAIVFPWQREKITALQYRFIDPTGRDDRFSQLAGGQRIAFGMDKCGTHFVTLWLIEGETNCLSLSQCLCASHAVNVDVLSFGPQDNLAQNSFIVDYAKRYRQVIIWADEPGIVKSAAMAVPNSVGLKSPIQQGVKLDANALLQHDVLLPFVRQVWEKFDSDPVYLGRCLAEFEEAEQLEHDQLADSAPRVGS